MIFTTPCETCANITSPSRSAKRSDEYPGAKTKATTKNTKRRGNLKTFAECIMKRSLALVSVLGLLSGVALSQDRADISKKIEQRVGHGLGPELARPEATLPPGVSLIDGLSEDEAIATALWNNAHSSAGAGSDRSRPRRRPHDSNGRLS
jgi:hypothetical protein